MTLCWLHENTYYVGRIHYQINFIIFTRESKPDFKNQKFVLKRKSNFLPRIRNYINWESMIDLDYKVIRRIRWANDGIWWNLGNQK